MDRSLATPLFGGCADFPEGVGPACAFDVAQGPVVRIHEAQSSLRAWPDVRDGDQRAKRRRSVGVLNRDFVLENCRWREIDGRAEFQGPQGYGQSLRNLPLAGRWRLPRLRARSTKLRLAAISKPSRDYLWILARRPDLAADFRHQLIDEARRSSNDPALCGSLAQVLGESLGRLEPPRRVDPR